MPVEIVREDAFGVTYFRNIYSSVNEKWYKKSWKEFDQLKDIDQKFYCSSYYDIIMLVLINMVLSPENH